MEIKKNQIYTMKIDDIGEDGEGIGKIDGYTLFVKDALIGDEIEVKVIKTKKSYGYGRLQRIIKPSPYRVEPRCEHAGVCGGCQLQHSDYDEQLRYKENKIRNLLERVGKLKDFKMLPIIGMEEPYYYRNKAQFPVGMSKDGRVIAGFYAKRTHSIIDIKHCCIQAPVNEVIIEVVKNWMQENGILPYDEGKHEGLVRHILTRVGKRTGEIMVCLVINGTRLPAGDDLVARLLSIEGMTSISFNVNRAKSNIILGDEVVSLYGPGYITDYIGKVKFQISPLSFYQVNPGQTEVLYGKVLEFAGLSKDKVVWDLYCGIGTISLFLAEKAKFVYGVEIVPQAIEDAKVNAGINGIENAAFFVGKAEEVLPRMYAEEGACADVIVVDPPRKGCDEELLDCMVRMAPERIVYVSCNPGTLARDLKVLEEKGYGVKKVQGVDMFGQCTHVETVVLLSHKKPDSYINVKVEFGEDEGEIPLGRITKKTERYKLIGRVTYKMIKKYIEEKYGLKVHTACIAEVKRSLGLPMHDAPNAVEELKNPRKHPTPEKVEAIKDALENFGVV